MGRYQPSDKIKERVSAISMNAKDYYAELDFDYIIPDDERGRNRLLSREMPVVPGTHDRISSREGHRYRTIRLPRMLLPSVPSAGERSVFR